MSLTDAESNMSYWNSFASKGGTRIFHGRVVYNSDPRKLFRVKVRIDELLPWDDPKKLPWLCPIFPITMSAGALSGNVAAPEVGTWVTCIFPHGDIYFGYYNGVILDSRTRLPNFQSEYPNRRGWQDSVGNSFIVNTADNKNTMELRTADGMIIQHDSKNSQDHIRDASGTEITLNRKKGQGVIKFGGVTIHIKDGKLKIESDEIEINGHKLVKTTSKGSVKIKSEGTTEITGPKCNILNDSTLIPHLKT